jgi:hypothetical protein
MTRNALSESLTGPLRKIRGFFYRFAALSFLGTNKSLETFLDNPRRKTKKIRLKGISRSAPISGDPRAPLVFDKLFSEQLPHKVKGIRILEMQQVSAVIEGKTMDLLGTAKPPYFVFLFKNGARNAFLPQMPRRAEASDPGS